MVGTFYEYRLAIDHENEFTKFFLCRNLSFDEFESADANRSDLMRGVNWDRLSLGFTAFDLGSRFWHTRPLIGDGLSSGLSKVTL